MRSKTGGGNSLGTRLHTCSMVQQLHVSHLEIHDGKGLDNSLPIYKAHNRGHTAIWLTVLWVQQLGTHCYTANSIVGSQLGTHCYTANSIVGSQLETHCYTANSIVGSQLETHCYMANSIVGSQSGTHCYTANSIAGSQLETHCYKANSIAGSQLETHCYKANSIVGSQLETHCYTANSIVGSQLGINHTGSYPAHFQLGQHRERSGNGSPNTANVFPRNGPLLVQPFRTLFILRRTVRPSGVFTPSHNPHTPPTIRPAGQAAANYNSTTTGV